MKLFKPSLVLAAAVLQSATLIKALGKDDVILEPYGALEEANEVWLPFFEAYVPGHLQMHATDFWNRVALPKWNQGQATKGSDWYDYLLEVGVSPQEAAKEVPDGATPDRPAAREVAGAAENVGEAAREVSEAASEAVQVASSLEEEVSSVRP
ncbi:uncharacterized protein SRS1_13900 [Sporisorium reilianum f. sp. reilianum]|uniref:Uncharacterized protein n=1 Tax=Sporisorium reilianum f. sp. reilianum TaxID=72559 RepID=A0A2N8UDM2_9BASI|nr:uncharacterized protein SRS1_13900 [Sporisorium reilianum f. sp. reilianum]